MDFHILDFFTLLTLEVVWVVSVVEQIPLPVRHEGDEAYFHMHQGEETTLESRAHGFLHVIANYFQQLFWKKRQGAFVLNE